MVTVAGDKCGEVPSPYPTNFFDDMVPKFVNNRPMVGIAAMEVGGEMCMLYNLYFGPLLNLAHFWDPLFWPLFWDPLFWCTLYNSPRGEI